MSITFVYLFNLAPPFVASSPHFYNGDPLLSQALNLAPTKEKHATFVDIEPVRVFYCPINLHEEM